MELQTIINNNPNYIEYFKNDGLTVKSYSKYNLILIKYPYDMDIDVNSYKKYCKGCIIDTSNNKIVFIPPIKSSLINNDGSNLPQNNFIVQELYDGTMINLFYHNDQWIMSTRSSIGCNNKWNNKKSFKKLFNECSSYFTGNPMDFDKLNKNYTYSFVMQHEECKNISHVNEKMLILVEVYDRFNYKPINNNELLPDENNYNGYTVANNFGITDINTLSEYTSNMKNNPYYSWKGYTVKFGNDRLNYINPLYDYVKNMKINSPNPLFVYSTLILKNDQIINEYIKYFPEYIKDFTDYQNRYKLFIDELHKNYIDLKITKNITQKDVPYHNKPVISSLHDLYLNNPNVNKITKDIVNEYVKTFDPGYLTFHLKYYK